jgi:hypothetical protein
MTDSTEPTLRPRDFATLLLASGDLRPRERARDQQADSAGARLKQRVLERLVELDPESSSLAAALDHIIAEFGDPTGPTRAVAAGIFEEFQAALLNPELAAWLLYQAAERTCRGPARLRPESPAGGP